MKKNITIASIVVLALAFGYFLFKISPQTQTGTGSSNSPFDIKNAEKISEPLPVSNADHINGNPEAKNTFVIYEDFQCPACASFKQYADKVPSIFKDTKVVFRHFPLYEIHKNATAAALASEAASAQGKFWEMYDFLYKNQAEWSNLADPSEKFYAYAMQAGVKDVEKFKSDFQNKTYFSQVEKNVQEGFGLGVTGTPTVYFNGHKLELNTTEEMEKQAKQYYK